MSAATDEQITLRELMEDKFFYEWMRKIPKHKVHTYSGKEWRVWVQHERGGPWAKRDFAKYAEAYNFLVRNLSKFHDAALSSRVQEHKPPIVRQGGKKMWRVPGKPGMHPSHEWCTLCRRPTIFTWFTRHHNFGKMAVSGAERRCAICGMRLVGMIRWRKN